jgi:arsenite/tail-anchored protein-transporting ATPase
VATNRPAFLDDDQLRLILFGGKGGVGKTTCSTAAALHLARRCPERSFLLASSDPAHSLLDSLAGAPLPPNLEYREIDFRQSLEDFKQAHAQHFHHIAMQGTFLDEDDISQFLELSTPGFDELMAFLDIAKWLQQQQYACMVIDTAPTGHTLRFLELPGLMRMWIGAFDAMLAKHRYLAQLYGAGQQRDASEVFLEELLASINQLADLLSDPVHCRFVPVMLAEKMSTRETLRLIERLSQLHIEVTEILVNRLYPTGSPCPVCRDAWHRQQRELWKCTARFTGVTLWGIPMQGGEICGNDALLGFWQGIDRVQAAHCPEPQSGRLPARVDHRVPIIGDSARLLLFAGKGGVGKTTLACATALSIADSGVRKKVLLFSADPAHSLADCLGVPIGPQPVPLVTGLWAMEVDAEAEFSELKQRYVAEVEQFFDTLLNGAGMDLQFDHQVVARILDLAPPGLDEVMALLRIVSFFQADQYDLFVLDTAPTGHLIRLLETPELIDRWLKAVFGLFLKYRRVFRLPKIVDYLVGLSKQLKILRGLLCDPHRTQLFAVSILTEMALAETTDLLDACQAAEVHVPVLFLNLATPPETCPLCQSVAAAEATVRQRFAESFDRVHQAVVYRCSEPKDIRRLTELGQALVASYHPQPFEGVTHDHGNRHLRRISST